MKSKIAREWCSVAAVGWLGAGLDCTAADQFIVFNLGSGRDAEAIAQEVFNVTQQGVILQGAENPALVIYALGKNPKKAAELAKNTDPVKFAFAVAKLEKELKVTNRRAAPAPERVIQGTGRVSGAVDSTLERLREEAARTGNMTKVIQYKAQKRAASKN